MRKSLTGNKTPVRIKQIPPKTKTRLRKTQKTNHRTKTRRIHHSQNATESAKKETKNQSQRTLPKPKWIRKSLRNSSPKKKRVIRNQGVQNQKLLVSRGMQKSQTPVVIQTIASKLKTVCVENLICLLFI